MYQSIPSLTIPPPRGFAHSSCPWGRVSLLRLARGLPGGILNQSKSSIILRKKTLFLFRLFNKWAAALLHMFIYTRSEQRDLGHIYTIANTQRIRIYPGKTEIHPGQNFKGSRTFTWQTYQRKPNSIHISYY